MFVVHLGLVALVLALIMLPRVFAMHSEVDDSVGREEYDYR